MADFVSKWLDSRLPKENPHLSEEHRAFVNEFNEEIDSYEYGFEHSVSFLKPLSCDDYVKILPIMTLARSALNVLDVTKRRIDGIEQIIGDLKQHRQDIAAVMDQYLAPEKPQQEQVRNEGPKPF